MIDRSLAERRATSPTAAARLGIHRATLYRKVKQFGLLRSGNVAPRSGAVLRRARR